MCSLHASCLNHRFTYIRRPPLCAKVNRLRAHLQSSEDLNHGNELEVLEGLQFLEKKEKELKQREQNRRVFDFDKKQSEAKPYSAEILTESEIDENEFQRESFHKRLYTAAMKGRANEAEAVIKQMIGLGIQPGPKAFHGLIFSYVKSGSASGALNAIRRAHVSGLNPLTESYVVLIHAFMKEQNIKNAEDVFKSMRRPDANVNAEAGWNMLITRLFQNESTELALNLLEEGRKEQFLPDNQLYSLSIQYHCNQGNIDDALEDLSEILVLEETAENGIVCSTEHLKPVLNYFCKEGNLLMMLWLLSLSTETQISSYTSVLRSIIKKWDESEEDLDGVFRFVWDLLQSDEDVDEDLEALTLYIIAEIKTGNTMNAQRVFLQRQLADVEGLSNRNLVFDLLPRLLVALSADGLPTALYNVLLMLSVTNMAVPENAFVPDVRGRTFVTQWLDGRLDNLNIQVEPNVESGEAEEVLTYTEDGRRVRIIDGVKIGFGSCVVDEQGTIVSLSKLKAHELRAECIARGLPENGTKKELYTAVKFARRAIPSIKDEVRRAQQLARKQKKLTQTEPKSSSQKKQSQGDSDSKVYYRYHYEHGELVKTEVLKQEEAEKLLTRPGSESESDQSDAADEELTEGLPSVSPENMNKWSDVFTLTSRQNNDLGTDETACGNAVVAISDLALRLGGYPTLEDFETMLYVIDRTRNPAAAWKLGNLVSRGRLNFRSEKTKQEEMEEDYKIRQRRILHVCARICITCGFPDSCEQLIIKMKELGITPDRMLVQEVEGYREKGTTELEGKYPSKEVELGPAAGEILPLVIDPLRPVRTEHPVDDEEDEQVENERPLFAPSSSSEEDESLEGFGDLNEIDYDSTTEESSESESEEDELISADEM